MEVFPHTKHKPNLLEIENYLFFSVGRLASAARHELGTAQSQLAFVNFKLILTENWHKIQKLQKVDPNPKLQPRCRLITS